MIFRSPSVQIFEQTGFISNSDSYKGPQYDDISGVVACVGSGKVVDNDDYDGMCQGLGRYATRGYGVPKGWHYEHLRALSGMNFDAMRKLTIGCIWPCFARWCCTSEVLL